MRTLPFALLTNALLLSAASSATPIDKTLHMAADGVVNLEFTNAIVHITGTKGNEFHISGELSKDAEEYELRETGSGIHFEENPKGHRSSWWNNWSSCWNHRDNDKCRDVDAHFSRLDITVPVGSIVKVENVNGDMSIENLSNNINLNTVNGELNLTNLKGSIKAESVNGRLNASKLHGRISLETVNGAIHDQDSQADRINYSTVNGDIESNVVSNDITAKTVNGDLELMLVTAHELELTTVGGRIDVETALANDADVEISSVHGRINLQVPDSTSARFQLTTAVNGNIKNQLTNDEAKRENRYVNGRKLNFTLNDGSANVEITTVSGDITLRKKK